MSKRSAGEGTFYHDDKRNLWFFQMTYYDAENQWHRQKFSGKTRRLALEKWKAFKEQLDKAKEPVPEVITVADWLHECMTTMVKPRIRARTYEKYVSSLKNYVLPAFGDMPLADLTTEALQRHFNGLLVHGGIKGTGISSSTVRAARRYLSMCLEEAVRAGKLERNPAKLTRPPKLTKKEIVVLTKDEVDRLIEAALEIDHPYMGRMMSELIALTAHTGLRQGEVFGLRWEDIDFEKRLIAVNRAVSYTTNQPIISTPKTKSGKRVIPLDDQLADFLMPHLETGYVIGGKEPPTLMVTRRLLRNLEKKIDMFSGHSNVTTTMGIFAHTRLGLVQEAGGKVAKLLQ